MLFKKKFTTWIPAFAGMTVFISVASAAPRAKFVPHQVIVCFRNPTASLSQVSSSAQLGALSNNAVSMKPISPTRKWGANKISNLSSQNAGKLSALNDQISRTFVVTLNNSSDVAGILASLKNNPDIEYAEPNYIATPSLAPNDPSYSNQWGLKNTGQVGGQGTDGYDPLTGTSGSDMDAQLAWDIQTGSTQTVVAVLDTGANWAHVDLAANIWRNQNEISGNSIDDDGNGYIDDVRGYDFGDGDNDPNDNCFNFDDDLNVVGHGTHVSGIIGAVGNNGIGVSGVNWNTRVMPLKAVDSQCEFSYSSIVSGILYATDNGANVVNMSFGGPTATLLQSAIDAADAAGVLLIAAAGNSDTNNTTNSYPAAYSNVISVAATDRNDTRAGFSNYGTWITLSAPGVGIYSTVPAGQGLYTYLSGTSMASPMTAGVAALIFSQYPTLTAAEVRSRLISSCENIDATNPSYIGLLGAGRINAFRALISLTSISPSQSVVGAPISITVTGVGFVSGMGIELSKAGQADITATNVVINSATSLTCDVDFTNVTGGRWDVSLTQGGNVLITLTQGITIFSSAFDVVTATNTVDNTFTVDFGSRIQTLFWPAGTLGQNVNLDFDGAPVLPSVDSTKDAFAPTGVGVEILPHSSLGAFSESPTITLTYKISDVPVPSKESALIIATYNSTTTRWEPLVSTVDTTLKTVTAPISHLSIFAVVQHTPSASLNQVVAFPNPFRVDRGHTRIIFDLLTAGSRLRLYDMSGELVDDLSDDNDDGQIIWPVTNESGQKVASGIYLYLVTDSNGDKKVGRVGVIR